MVELLPEHGSDIERASDGGWSEFGASSDCSVGLGRSGGGLRSW